MRNFGEIIVGGILFLIGAVMLMTNIVVTSFGFYHIGNFSTGGVLIILLIVAIAAVAAKPNKLTYSLLAASFILILISVIMSTRLYIRHMSFLSYVVILGFIGVGIGIIIRWFLGSKKR